MKSEKYKEFKSIKNFLWRMIWNLEIEADDYEAFFHNIIDLREEKIGKNPKLGHTGLLINNALWEIGRKAVKIRLGGYSTFQKCGKAKDMLNLLNECAAKLNTERGLTPPLTRRGQTRKTP